MSDLSPSGQPVVPPDQVAEQGDAVDRRNMDPRVAKQLTIERALRGHDWGGPNSFQLPALTDAEKKLAAQMRAVSQQGMLAEPVLQEQAPTPDADGILGELVTRDAADVRRERVVARARAEAGQINQQSSTIAIGEGVAHEGGIQGTGRERK